MITYSISRLNTELHQVLRGSFPLLWVEGEISNLSKPRSGHYYFNLQDAHAQIRCAIFRHKRHLLRLTPENGLQVLARARVALYEPRGDCQLVIEHMEIAGAGESQRAFEALKQQLQKEGLFDTERKKTLPAWPTSIGLITSPSGAAWQDVLQVLARRYPLARVVLYPASVQGEQAPKELHMALSLALQRAEVDVLILTRGGGSPEDLIAFNDEKLARLIAQAQIPLVSAIGHEIDFTIADFVADRRAPTPSAAAELVSPDQATLKETLSQTQRKLYKGMQTYLLKEKMRYAPLVQRLMRTHPGHRLNQQQQYLDELQQRLEKRILWRLEKARHHWVLYQKRLYARWPGRLIGEAKRQLKPFNQRLQTAMLTRLQHKRAQLQACVAELDVLSPLATLQRGYSIVQRTDLAVVRSSAEVAVGDKLRIRLRQGRVDAQVLHKQSIDA